MVDRCVVCGAIVPEGRQVCLHCENNVCNNDWKKETEYVAKPESIGG